MLVEKMREEAGKMLTLTARLGGRKGRKEEQMSAYIETIDFGFVPIRKRFTDGMHCADIEIAANNSRECFAEIRTDYKTNQPFAVLFDENWQQIV